MKVEPSAQKSYAEKAASPRLAAAVPKLIVPLSDLTDRPVVSAVAQDWPGIRLTTFRETDGQIIMPPTERDALMQTVEGYRAHHARVDGTVLKGAISPGDIAMVPQGAEIRAHWHNNIPIQTFRIAEFDAALFTDYLPESRRPTDDSRPVMMQGFATRPTIGPLMDILNREIDPAHRRGNLFAQAAIRLLALEIAAARWGDNVLQRDSRAETDPRVRRAIDFIEAHFNTDISILQIAAASGLSPTQLTRAFRQATAQTPYDYVIGRRLDHAVALLRTSDLPIAYIALDSGFTDQAHLTRLCRARLGRTPGTIRRSH